MHPLSLSPTAVRVNSGAAMKPHIILRQGSIVEVSGQAMVHAANRFPRAVFRKSFWLASIPHGGRP